MKLPLIAVMVLLGFAMGGLTLAGTIPQGFELPLWIVIAVAAALWIGLKVQTRRFLNGFVGGLLAGLASPLLQLLFFDAYLAHNPYAAQSFKTLPAAISPRVFIACVAPVIAILYGLAVGFLAWLAGRIFRRGPRPAPSA